MEVFPAVVGLIIRALVVSARWAGRARRLALERATAAADASREAAPEARVAGAVGPVTSGIRAAVLLVAPTTPVLSTPDRHRGRGYRRRSSKNGSSRTSAGQGRRRRDRFGFETSPGPTPPSTHRPVDRPQEAIPGSQNACSDSAIGPRYLQEVQS